MVGRPSLKSRPQSPRFPSPKGLKVQHTLSKEGNLLIMDVVPPYNQFEDLVPLLTKDRAYVQITSPAVWSTTEFIFFSRILYLYIILFFSPNLFMKYDVNSTSFILTTYYSI